MPKEKVRRPLYKKQFNKRTIAEQWQNDILHKNSCFSTAHFKYSYTFYCDSQTVNTGRGRERGGNYMQQKVPGHESNQGCCNYMVCVSTTWLPTQSNVTVKQSRKGIFKVHVDVICELNRNRFSWVPLPINLQRNDRYQLSLQFRWKYLTLNFCPFIWLIYLIVIDKDDQMVLLWIKHPTAALQLQHYNT